MPISTSNSNDAKRGTVLAVGGAIVLLAVARCIFFVIPEAFAPYPEALFDLSFYTVDYQCKAEGPEPQVLIQGTSRSQLLRHVPIGAEYWRDGAQTVNISIPGNTFWHKAAIRRRNPEFFSKADLLITDVMPMDLHIGYNFDETTNLFFRESTLVEKLLIRDPRTRLRALADWVLPAWSRRYTPATWWKALTHLNATDEEKLSVLRQTSFLDFPEFGDWISQLEGTGGDEGKVLELIIGINYPAGPVSRVQEYAFRKIVSQPPPNGHLLFVHPPYRQEFEDRVADVPARREARETLHRLLDAAASDRVAVRWFEDPRALGLNGEDFAGDGLHLTAEGYAKLEQYLGGVYREVYPEPAGRN